MIYEEVLAGDVLHVIGLHQRLGFIRCKARGVLDSGLHSCWNTVPPEGSAPEPGRLSLLKTCRQVYSEAIDILYARNSFDVNHLNSLLYLSSTIPAQRLNTIRSLQLTWDFPCPLYTVHSTSRYPPDTETTWEEVWRVIARMKGLRDIRVQLTIARIYTNLILNSEVRLLEPLRAVKPANVFEVHVSWPGREGMSEMKDVPFRIQRPRGQPMID